MLLLALLLAPQPAAAYTPEALLSRYIAPAPEIEAPGEHQYLSPFSRVILGYQHGFGSESGRLSPDSSGRVRDRTDHSREDELRIDLRPKGIKEARAYKRYADALRAGAAVARKSLQTANAENAYQLLIQATLAKEEKALAGEWRATLEKARTLGKLEARRSEASAKSLLRTMAEIDKANAELVEIDSKVTSANSSLASRNLSVDELETADIVEPADIEALLDKPQSAGAALSRQLLESDLELAAANLEHGIAERGHLVEGVKLAVNKGRNNIARSTYSSAGEITSALQESRTGTAFKVEVSFNLPFLAAQDLGESHERLKYIRMEADRRQKMEEASARSGSLRPQLREKIELFTALGAALNSSRPANALLAQDPGLALELQRTSMTRRFLRAKLKAEIRSMYIEMLRESGELAEQPERNWLSRTARRI